MFVMAKNCLLTRWITCGIMRTGKQTGTQQRTRDEMKLYHATPVEDTESISEVGIFPTDGGSKAHGEMMSLQGKGLMGIFGFKSVEDAESFAIDNGSEYGIFTFETGDLDTMIDPEYENGESIFVITDEPIAAEFVRNL